MSGIIKYAPNKQVGVLIARFLACFFVFKPTTGYKLEESTLT